MSIIRFLPHPRQEWSSSVLFLFKAYVVVAFVMPMLYSEALRVDATVVYVTLGYILSFFVLLVCAVVQFISGRREAALSSLAFAGLAFIFGWQLLPYLAS